MLDKSLVIKRNSFVQKLGRLKCAIWPPLTVIPISPDIEIQRDVAVRMRDGVELSVNIYKPKVDNVKVSLPALLSLHPYCKDNLPKGGSAPYQYRAIRQPSMITFSEETGWEAPDPEYWVNQGYVVINIDKRGFGKSGGVQEFFNDSEAQDYYDVIEWVANQDWSNKKVGLLGVSYLAVSQYKVAALRPPHLTAICPWEGFSDIYKDVFRPGGIREDGFSIMWSSQSVKQKETRDIRQELVNRELRDEFFQGMVPDLGKIEVPALVCASFSDHQLHTRGTFRMFEQIKSKHKWLYTHRTGKWVSFYSDEAKALQLKFFDHFLKDLNNGMQEEPAVRLEVRDTGDLVHKIRSEKTWPLPNIKWHELYLNPLKQTLETSKNISTDCQELKFITTEECAKFQYVFDKTTEVIGPMKATIFLKLFDVTDMNVFVGVQKFRGGSEINFEGSFGFANDIVTKGFMKVSMRRPNLQKSLPYYPEHDFDKKEELKPEEVAKLEISLLPSATVFKTGDELRFVVQGVFFHQCGKLDQVSYFEKSSQGVCSILCTGDHASSLLLPFVD